MIICTVGLSISILVYIIVFQYVFAYKLGWFPVQGWGNELLGEPRQVRVAADPDRAGRQHRAQSSAVPHVRARRDQPGLRAHGARQGRGREPRDVGARAAQCVDPDHHARDGGAARLLIGAFLLERFFSIPGIGREVILAVERSDFPVIKALTVYVAVATMVVNLLADLMYKAVDPRVQLRMIMASNAERRAQARGRAGIPHTVSPGLWTLAWRRLRNDTPRWSRSRSSSGLCSS